MSKKDKKNKNEKSETVDKPDVENVEINDEKVETKNDEKIEEKSLGEGSNEEELNNEVKTLKDQLLRKAAEFENYKRRTENDQLNLIKYAAESFIIKILPIYDDLNRSLNHITSESKVESIKEGLELVLQKFKNTLEEQGIKKIETKGKQFDFNLHEALMQQPSSDVPPHTILEEVEAGYLFKDKVIKHSKVIVSQEIIEDENKNSDESKSE